MDIWLIWVSAGIVMALLELIVPGGILVFLGLSALVVGGGVYFNLLTTIHMAFIAWFIISIVFMLFLRSLFMKYFEGDTSIQEVGEENEYAGSLVEIVELIEPFKDGRVMYKGTTWTGRSEVRLEIGSKARVIKREGSALLIEEIK